MPNGVSQIDGSGKADDFRLDRKSQGPQAALPNRIEDDRRGVASRDHRAVSKTGGHLGAGLGVVELTVALHYVFDTPTDKLIWDVGHQAYPHKILTGRSGRIHTLRTGGGLSGFTKRSESEYDPFGAAHAATSISAALGMAAARNLTGRSNNVVAVIGDGSMSAGMAYEALNNAASTGGRLIVVLNDNAMSIAPPVGALSVYLSRLTKDPNPSGEARDDVRGLGVRIRRPDRRARRRRTRRDAKKARDSASGPILIHAVTRKGKGYPPAERPRCVMPSRPSTSRRDAGQKPGEGPDLHQGVRRSLVKEAPRTPASSQSPPPCRAEPASTSSPRLS